MSHDAVGRRVLQVVEHDLLGGAVVADGTAHERHPRWASRGAARRWPNPTCVRAAKSRGLLAAAPAQAPRSQGRTTSYGGAASLATLPVVARGIRVQDGSFYDTGWGAGWLWDGHPSTKPSCPAKAGTRQREIDRWHRGFLAGCESRRVRIEIDKQKALKEARRVASDRRLWTAASR